MHSFWVLAAVTGLVCRPTLAADDTSSSSSKCTLGPGHESHDIKNATYPWPHQFFKSAPFQPPALEITANGEPLAPGDLFITPTDGFSSPPFGYGNPTILTDKGQLVWNGPNINATNFRTATYRGKPVLTYWNGIITTGPNIGHGYGNVTYLDSSYNELFTVCPDLGLVNPDGYAIPCQGDAHESYATDRDTLIVSAYNATPTDLSSIGGPKDGWIFNCLFFELEPSTGKILFKWSAIDHVPVKNTHATLGSAGTKEQPLDYFHINSIVNVGNGYLVSGRHTWSVYSVNHKGNIDWTLQGETGGDFGPLPADGQFRWQHFARPTTVTTDAFTLSIFNNNFNNHNSGGPTTGLTLRLPLSPTKNKPKSPVVVLQDLLVASDPLDTGSQGSNQLLTNGNRLMDYGQIAVIREFGPKGNSDLRWTATFGDPVAQNVQSYRAYKDPWQGYPTTAPNLVINATTTKQHPCPHAFVSWNGATDVTAWVVYEGASPNHLKDVEEITYAGFETRFRIGSGSGNGKCVQVVPKVDGKAQQRSASNVACTK